MAWSAKRALLLARRERSKEHNVTEAHENNSLGKDFLCVGVAVLFVQGSSDKPW